ncbi:epoxyqueuosine reductase QueH, partial [Candidatus Margulisiibacteriota bacterium]
MRKILLHACCGPCTTYVNKWLTENDFAVKGLFYNPNIRPRVEYEKRLLTMEHYATVAGLEVILEPNDIEILPDECVTCYIVRLTKTALKAKELGYDC